MQGRPPSPPCLLKSSSSQLGWPFSACPCGSVASRHESVWRPELRVAEGQWEPPPPWHEQTAASLMGSRAQSAQGPAPWPTGTLDGPENKHQSEGETEKASFRQPAVTDSAKTR